MNRLQPELMLRTFASSCLVFLLCTVGTASAQIDAASAEQLMRKSGMWMQVASLGPQMRSGLAAGAKQGASAIKPAELQGLLAAADSIFAAEPMRRSALRVISRSVDPTYLPALNSWFDSALGRNLVKLEEAANASNLDPAKVARDGNALLAAMAPAKRALLQEMSAVMRAPELVTTIMINTTLAIQQGIASVSPGAPGPSRQELRAMMEAQRPQMLQAFGVLILATFASTYTSISLDQMQQYLTFLKSPAGQHYAAVEVLAYEAALVEAATELGKTVPGARQGST